MKLPSFLKKNSSNSYLTKICLVMLIAYICIYLIFVRPIYSLHNIQTKEWMHELTTIMICGLNYRKLYDTVRVDGRNISFWYCYWAFDTKKYTIWVLFNLHNKNSNDATINVYSYNNDTHSVTNNKMKVNFENITTRKTDDDTIIIQYNKNYTQYVNFKNNTTGIKINIEGVNMELNASVADFITNQASFIPRYRALDYLLDMNGHCTDTPGEWMCCNPYNGTIMNGKFNGDIIESNGSFWSENHIGCNNYYVEPYTWFVIMNDEWIIYLLWFGDYKSRNDPCNMKAVLIKDRKNNKYIHSGCPGTECFKSIPIFKNINLMLSPIKTMTYNSEYNIGEPIYDNHHLNFVSDKIKIKIDSIENSFTKVYDYDYYKTGDINLKKENSWEVEYQSVLNNLKYVNYIGQVNVEIQYNGDTIKFKSSEIVDAFYRTDKNIPAVLKFKEE